MSELSELYQAVILDHNKKPRNFHKLENANRTAEGFNPLCGDHLNVYLHVEDDQVKEVSFEGSGCVRKRSEGFRPRLVIRAVESWRINGSGIGPRALSGQRQP